jgi:hypothetical protein
MEADVLSLLDGLGVGAFTDVPKVFGLGESGSAFASFERPGFNSMILAALEEGEVPRVVDGVSDFHRRQTRRQHGANVPLHAFVIPCIQIA